MEGGIHGLGVRGGCHAPLVFVVSGPGAHSEVVAMLHEHAEACRDKGDLEVTEKYTADCLSMRRSIHGLGALGSVTAAPLAWSRRSVVTWGNAHCGGVSCAVKGQLRDVQYIQATKDACAANVQHIQATTDVFAANVQLFRASADALAAFLADGSV